MTDHVHDLMSPNELYIAAEVALLRSCMKRGVIGFARYHDIADSTRHAFRVGYRSGEQWLKENLASIEPSPVTSRESKAFTRALGYLTRVTQEMLGDIHYANWCQGFESRIGDYCQKAHDDRVCFLPTISPEEE